MHRGGVIRGNPPAQRLVSFVSRGKSGWMVFCEMVPDLVHVRHEEQADRLIRLVSDTAREGIANTEVGDFGGELFVFPLPSLRRPVEPLEMMLIDAVLNHLEIITVHHPRAQRARSVFPDQHVVARQKRRRLGSKVGKNNPSQLLNFVGRVTDSLPKGAVSRLAGLFQDAPADVIEPAVVTAAQATVLDMSKF